MGDLVITIILKKFLIILRYGKRGKKINCIHYLDISQSEEDFGIDYL